MSAKFTLYAIGALAAAFAWGQPGEADRTFHFEHTEGTQSIMEVATVIRSIGEIRELTADAEKRTMTVRGTGAQIALAEWLFHELDSPGPGTPHEYKLAGSDEVVRVDYVTAAETLRGFQQIAVEVRSATRIRRLFTYNAPRAIVMRGTPEQLAMAGRLIRERSR